MMQCSNCSHEAPYRDGLRFCAACAAPLLDIYCRHCTRGNFQGDRYCGFCAHPLEHAPAALAAPQLSGGASPAADESLAQLVAEARLRAQARNSAPEAPIKQHLNQADIDRLFGA